MAEGNSVVLGPKDSLVGTLRIEGDLQVRGTVEGEIVVSGDISIESTAVVQARLEARNVTIRGEVTGPVNSNKKLQVSGSGTLNGDAQVGRLVVEDGATVNGSITMNTTGGGKSNNGHSEKARENSQELTVAGEEVHQN